MGKLDAFTIAGLRLFFNSNDHAPPHFHAEKPGCWEIRVFFTLSVDDHLEFSVRWPERGPGLSAAERKRILERILFHRVALIREWYAKVRTNQEDAP